MKVPVNRILCNCTGHISCKILKSYLFDTMESAFLSSVWDLGNYNLKRKCCVQNCVTKEPHPRREPTYETGYSNLPGVFTHWITYFIKNNLDNSLWCYVAREWHWKVLLQIISEIWSRAKPCQYFQMCYLQILTHFTEYRYLQIHLLI